MAGSWNPAVASGLSTQKGKIAEGYDADLILVDNPGSPTVLST